MKNNTIDFQWEMTEEDFRRMMHEEQTVIIFGRVRFGEYLVEFRCSNDGFDDESHFPVTDVYHYGEEGPEQYFLGDVPYHILDEDFAVPRRRTMAAFKALFEAAVRERLTTGMWWHDTPTEMTWERATAPTVSHEDWNPVKKEEVELKKPQEIRVETALGTIVVTDKQDPVYPGVSIDLLRNGRLMEVAMVDVDQDMDADEPALLKAHVYDTEHDEPIFDLYRDAGHIDAYLAKLA